MYFCHRLDFIFANSVSPDEMPHHAAFHLGVHCLQVSRILRVNET